MSQNASETTAAPSRPKIGQYKGHPMIILNPDERFPFQFGINKARLILAHIEEIRSFVEQTERAERTAAPAQAAA